jgi:uncharacterized peroxidase-related enzyme
MAWIKEKDPKQDQRLQTIYEDVRKRTKQDVDHIYRVHSLDAKALENHKNLYEHLMFGESELSRKEREMIAVVVSSANGCPYCITHHEEALRYVTDDQALMEKIAKDYSSAPLTRRERAMLDYAKKLTETPYQMVQDDIVRMRLLQLSDLAIFQINQIVAYFNYVNRIVFGLGVELEQR